MPTRSSGARVQSGPMLANMRANQVASQQIGDSFARITNAITQNKKQIAENELMKSLGQTKDADGVRSVLANFSGRQRKGYTPGNLEMGVRKSLLSKNLGTNGISDIAKSQLKLASSGVKAAQSVYDSVLKHVYEDPKQREIDLRVATQARIEAINTHNALSKEHGGKSQLPVPEPIKPVTAEFVEPKFRIRNPMPVFEKHGWKGDRVEIEVEGKFVDALDFLSGFKSKMSDIQSNQKLEKIIDGEEGKPPDPNKIKAALTALKKGGYFK